jgi:hypothetical protein
MPRSPLAINAKAQANAQSSLKIDLERAAATGASNTCPGQLDVMSVVNRGEAARPDVP